MPMTSDFTSYPQRPLTPIELLRVGAALLPFGLPYGEGFPDNEIWIAMETALPNRMIGIAASRASATALISARGEGAPAADVYGPFAPPPATMGYLDESDATDHNDTTMRRTETSIGDLRQFHRKHAELTRITLTLEWARRDDLPTSAVMNIDPHSDTIFLTRASREAFAYPRYLAIFGPDYVAALRQTLDET
jgi:hypothetical protein